MVVYSNCVFKEGKVVMSLAQIAVLIPCYNESQTIRKVIMDFKSVLPEAIIYVYDNNSGSIINVGVIP